MCFSLLSAFYLITKLLENAATHGARGVFGPQVIDDEKRPVPGVEKFLDLGIHRPILQEDHGSTGLHVFCSHYPNLLIHSKAPISMQTIKQLIFVRLECMLKN